METFMGKLEGKVERRVALVPADVRRLTERATVTVERGAGAGAGHRDDAYIDVGATTTTCSSIPRHRCCSATPNSR